ncbi:hypothetical protein PHET_06234 [Paragonimus heterotremus]|uniref:Uncharacterized protein n=1 Tax=Paragonimus heterotremus TaxID=100268 RepID=A0A8J4WHM0_9TREM|nr:hypothetical protein PHET_06234 [Paragonimus heterotremus]
MAHLRTYNMKVLIGNWWEERIYKDEEQKSDAHRAYIHNELSKALVSLSQRDYNKECIPAPFDGYARIGMNIQILNPGISSYYEKMGLASPRDAYALALGITNTYGLSVLIAKRVTNIFEKLHEENVLKIVATRCVEAAKRNLFRIESPYTGNDGSLVRYGQSVMLTLKPMIAQTEANTEGPLGQPLYLASDVEHLCDPLDEKVIIKHVRTNKSLALEPDFLIPNVFGRDANVSANTYYDSHKAERDVNIWTLTSARQPGVCGDNRATNRAALPITADNTSSECDMTHQTTCGHQAA